MSLLLLMSGDIERNPGPPFMHCISIIHSNIRSIRHKLNFIKENLLDFDILCFTETHLDVSVETDSLALSEVYDSPYRKDRTNHGGGILVYCNKSIISQRMPDLEVFWHESIWVKIKQKADVFLLGVFYSPKTSDARFFERLNENIEAASELSKNIIIVGDFNEDLLNDAKHYLKDILLVNSFHNVITEPTRGRALLDPILVPFEQHVMDKGVIDIPNSISDHRAPFITLPFEYPLSSTYKRTVWLYNKGNYQALQAQIDEYDWNFINDAPINEAPKIFEETFLKIVNECIPSKEVTIRTDDKPWYDSEIRKTSRQRDRLKKKAIKSKNPAHWQAYKSIRNKVNNLKKHAKEMFYNNLEYTLTETASSNKRDFWKLVRHFVKENKTSDSIPPLSSTDENNQTQIHVTDQEKVECLNNYFTSISTTTNEPPTLPNLMPKTNSKLESIVITEQEVIDVLESLNINKASGPDLISNKMLKCVAKSFARPLTALFNRLLRNRKFPEIWKFSHVISLFKKGEKYLPSNYRPVALLSNLGKAMERIVFKRMYNFLNDNDLLYKYQSGFIPGHSTTFQLIDIYHHICQTFDQNQFSCMVFFDISKAFDRVWHPGLLHKLEQNGISGDLLQWLSDYLTNRTQCVVLNSVTSTKRPTTAGVPQGSVLGPLLFLIYVNDISENLLSLTRLFADDSSLFVSASDLRDIEGILNHDLILVSAWARQWLVNFNPNKTEAMLFSYRQSEEYPNLIFDGVNIKFVSDHKHLGLIFSDNMKWNVHIESILNRASRMIGIMRKLKYVFSRRALNQTYISFVRPVLEYSSIVWDGCTVEQRNSLEKLQNESARIVTGLTKSVSLDRLYNECGWQPLHLRRKNQKLKFMYRAANGMVPSYISDIVPPTVANVSQYNLRNSANLSVIPTRTSTFGKSCIPSAISDWNNLQLSSRECDSYNSFCNELNRQNQIKVPSYFFDGKRRFSILHARLRNFCSNLNQDLYDNYLRDDSVCSCLRSNESAAHYFFECKHYEEQRIKLFTDTREFHPLNIRTLLKGKDSLSDSDNCKIFIMVQYYIQADLISTFYKYTFDATFPKMSTPTEY